MWGIVLVLEHCVFGIEALIADAHHGLWLHGSCSLSSPTGIVVLGGC